MGVTDMKTQNFRERKAVAEQSRTMQQSLDGTLKSALTELESKVFCRVDREAAARAASIVQVLDDIGTVLEKKVPSNLRPKESISSTIPVEFSATEESIQSGKLISGSMKEVKSAKGSMNVPVLSARGSPSPVRYRSGPGGPS